jgi:hypothetical protein
MWGYVATSEWALGGVVVSWPLEAEEFSLHQSTPVREGVVVSESPKAEVRGRQSSE